jgi:zinc/manganese transport system substrate-binding protein
MRSRFRVRPLAALLAIGVTALSVTGCATSPKARGTAAGGAVIEVAASISAWGSILSQLGGSRVKASSIIANPDTDPHAYEPTPADGRTIALSRVFVENGAGYDPWAQQSIAASPDRDRTVVDVGQLVGVPAGGNPHRWYSPADVDLVAAAITAALKHADPNDAGYFDGRLRSFRTDALAQYHQLISDIRAKYAGTPVGASESIFAPLANALGLNLITPAGLLKAVSEGTDPAAADKATVDAQIANRKIKVYVFNSQNSTPDVTAQLQAAERAGIPVATVTETLSPVGASFQQWQTAQLRSLQAALQRATAR